MWNRDASLDREGTESQVKPVFDERRLAAWIGKSVVVRGDVICSENLTIDGQVEGTIEVGDHGLTIGVGASIKADLIAKTITIGGAITGNVTARERVDLRATGSVDGDIVTPRFAMADGAMLRGRVATTDGKVSPVCVAAPVGSP